MVATLTACDALACMMTVHTPAQQATQQALVIFISFYAVWGVEPFVTHQTSAPF